MPMSNARTARTSRRSRSRARSGAEAARRRSVRRLSSVLGNGTFLLLGLSVLALGAVLALAGRQASSDVASAGSAPTPPSDWIMLRSTAPADIVAAARQSTLFRDSGMGTGDHTHDLSRLGTPVLVRALQPADTTGGRYPDFYVLPILDGSGASVEAAELQLNPAQTAIHVITLVTYAQPRAHGAIARLDATAAEAAVRAEQHTDLRRGATPELVYFPGDASAQASGQAGWQGGGELPADPIWLVPGADGQDHLAGADGHAYDLNQLPMVQAGQ